MNRLKVGMFILLALMLVLIPLLGACAKEETPALPTEEEASPSPPEEEYIIRFACSFPSVSTLAQLFMEKAEELAEETNGRVKLESYWGGALYSQDDAFAAVQEGSLEGTIGGCFITFMPEWSAIMTMPFPFDDAEHYLRFTETDVFKAMQEKAEAMGFLSMGLICATAAYPFNNKRPIASLEDWEGLKMRMPASPGFKVMAEAFGCSMVSVDPAEVVTALETGMVDGVIATCESWPVYRVPELCPYGTKIPLQFMPAELLVSKKWYESLPADVQQIVKRAFEEIAAEHYQIMLEKEEEMWVELASYPQVVITELTVAEKMRWLEAAEAAKEAAAAGDPDVAAMIEAIDSVR